MAMPFGAKSFLRGWDNRDLGASFMSFMIYGSSRSLASAHRGRKNYKGPPSREGGPEQRRNRTSRVHPPQVRRDTEDCAPHDRPESARGGVRSFERPVSWLAPFFGPLPGTEDVPVGTTDTAELTVAGPRRSCTGLPEHLPRLCCLPDHYTAKDGNVKRASPLRRTPDHTLLPEGRRSPFGRGALRYNTLGVHASRAPEKPRGDD